MEFALVAPILIALVLGIFEFGQAFYTKIAISAAAREGVRVLALNTTPATTVADARTAISAAASPLVIPAGSIAMTTCPATPGPTDKATVTISYTYSFIGGIFGPPVVLHGKGVMRCNG